MTGCSIMLSEDWTSALPPAHTVERGRVVAAATNSSPSACTHVLEIGRKKLSQHEAGMLSVTGCSIYCMIQCVMQAQASRLLV